MNYIHDLDEFNKLVRNTEELIIYPGGYEGYMALEYLQYLEDERPWVSDYVDHTICCITTGRELVERHNPFNHNIPVLHWSYLPHFRETATMIVAAPNTEHERIYNMLASFGFKNIIFIDSKLNAQLKSEVDNFLVSGQALSWFIRRVNRKIIETQHMIAEQNEVRDVNMKAFGEYQNAFRDKEVVIVGNGSTLKYYKPIPNAIHVGLNLAWLDERISFDYMFTADEAKSVELGIKSIDGCSKIKNKVFVSMRQHGVNHTDFSGHSANTSFMKNVERFFLNGLGIEEPIFKDIRYHPLASFQSVVFPAIHFALFTYPKKLYLVGCDTSSYGHFYSKNIETASGLNVRSTKVGYAVMKRFAEQHYPDTKIISINPVGLKGLFEDIYTDDYKKILEA